MTRSSIRTLFALLAVLVLAVGFTACGEDEDTADTTTPAAQTTQPAESGDISAEEKAANKIQPVQGASNVSLTVGSKNFTEQFILGEIYAQALEAAGYNVKKDLDLGSELVAYRSLRGGDIDAYPEYTGTALTSFFNVKIADVPKDAAQAYEEAKEAYAKQNITALAPTPFENTYRMAITKATAEKLGNPTKISDLEGKAQDLVVNGYPECRQRIDCLLGVQRNYGLDFKRFLPGNNPYQVLDSGDADIAFVFSTDGPLSTDKYVVLDDDKSIFPPYNITFAVRDEVAEQLGPEGAALIESVQENLTEDVMQELNSRVVLDKQKPEKVAADYLREAGFVK